MIKILFDGAYGIQSYGDDAALIVLVRMLKSRIGKMDAIAISRHPEGNHYAPFGVRSRSGIEYSSKEESLGKWFYGFNPDDEKEDLRSLYYEIESSNLLVLGAGNFLNDYTIDIGKGPIPRFFIMSLMAKMAGTPIMWFGIAGGPLVSEYGKGLVRACSDWAAVITVRDLASEQLLKRIGVRKAINVLPDPVYEFSSLVNRGESAFSAWNKAHASSKNVIAISVRAVGSVMGMSYENYVEVMARFCESMVANKDVSILFIPQCTYEHGSPREDDRNVAREIIDASTVQSRMFSIEDSLNAEECLSLYKGAKVTVATRLHGNVFSAIQGVPSIGIAYNRKVNEFHRDMQTSDLCIDLKQLSVDLLIQKVYYTIEKHDIMSRKFKRVSSERERIASYGDYVFGVLDI